MPHHQIVVIRVEIPSRKFPLQLLVEMGVLKFYELVTRTCNENAGVVRYERNAIYLT